MHSTRRRRAALGFTLILLAGLGLLALFRSLAPPAGLPSPSRGEPIAGRPQRLFEVPLGPLATKEAEYALADWTITPYLLYIPRLQLYAPVVPIRNATAQIGDALVAQLSLPPAYAVGWSADSARIGQPGNTVFVGHNNEFGDVFRDLNVLEAGDEVFVRAGDGDRRYVVKAKAIFEEQFRSLEERLANAVWLASTDDERLTLITCWPYFTNTHRVVVVAAPALASTGEGH